MKSFGWKRKAGSKVDKPTTDNFLSNSKDDINDEEIDWLEPLSKKRVIISLEDTHSKYERLKSEGVTLAESERYWEAINKWDEAIQIKKGDEKLWEMKTQALMALGEVFPALQSADKTLELAPTWWVAYQTKGRALVNIGEVSMALKYFSKAAHLNPDDKELWKEDLLWAKSLLDQRKATLETAEMETNPPPIREITNGTNSLNNKENEPQASEAVHQEVNDLNNSSNRRLRKVPRNYIHMRDFT